MAETDKIIFPLIIERVHIATKNNANFEATIYPDEGYQIISILPRYCTVGQVGGGSIKMYPSFLSIKPTEVTFSNEIIGYTVILENTFISVPSGSLLAIRTYQAKI